jgi:hypothetical protein
MRLAIPEASLAKDDEPLGSVFRVVHLFSPPLPASRSLRSPFPRPPLRPRLLPPPIGALRPLLPL